MIKKLMIIAWIAIVGVGIGCDGPKGDVGPAGPQGPKGETGAAGANGTNGTNGIMAKEIVAGAVKSTNGGYTLGKANLTSADTAMISKSVVVLFIKSQGIWWAQPGKVEFGDGKFTEFNFTTLLRGTLFYVNIVPTSWSEEDKSKAPDRDFEGIRAVLIPAEKLRTNANVNWTNYKETMAALGLKE